MSNSPLSKTLHQAELRALLPSYGLDSVALGEWLSSLPPELLPLLMQATQPRAYRHGEVLFHKGERTEGLYFIQSGEVRASSLTEGGSETVLYLFERGSCVGLVSCLDGEPSPSTCCAHGDTAVRFLPRHLLLGILEAEPHYYRHFTALLLRWVRGLLTVVEDQAVLDIRARLAKRLLQLAYIYGEVTPAGVLIAMRLPQEELAQMLGATRQSVNQHISDFRERGWLRAEQGEFTLIDIAALQACVQGAAETGRRKPG